MKLLTMFSSIFPIFYELITGPARWPWKTQRNFNDFPKNLECFVKRTIHRVLKEGCYKYEVNLLPGILIA